MSLDGLCDNFKALSLAGELYGTQQSAPRSCQNSFFVDQSEVVTSLDFVDMMGELLARSVQGFALLGKTQPGRALPSSSAGQESSSDNVTSCLADRRLVLICLPGRRRPRG